MKPIFFKEKHFVMAAEVFKSEAVKDGAWFIFSLPLIFLQMFKESEECENGDFSKGTLLFSCLVPYYLALGFFGCGAR